MRTRLPLTGRVLQLVLQVLDENVKQGSNVYEKGHLLILGWLANRKDEEIVWKVLSQVGPCMCRLDAAQAGRSRAEPSAAPTACGSAAGVNARRLHRRSQGAAASGCPTSTDQSVAPWIRVQQVLARLCKAPTADSGNQFCSGRGLALPQRPARAPAACCTLQHPDAPQAVGAPAGLGGPTKSPTTTAEPPWDGCATGGCCTLCTAAPTSIPAAAGAPQPCLSCRSGAPGLWSSLGSCTAELRVEI